MILAPSILAADFKKLGEQIVELTNAGADYLHIDVMDGKFVPSISFGMPVISSIRPVTSIPFDVHLMIEEPIRYVSEFAAIGADIITVHLEACTDVRETLRAIKATGCKVGLSVKPGTPVEEVFPYLPMIDMVLVMTVEPGFGGQKYLEESDDRIKAVRAEITRLGLSVDLEIDGGVTRDNVDRVLNAGANVIVAGSAVFHENITSNVTYFKKK